MNENNHFYELYEYEKNIFQIEEFKDEKENKDGKDEIDEKEENLKIIKINNEKNDILEGTTGEKKKICSYKDYQHKYFELKNGNLYVHINDESKKQKKKLI